MIEHDWGMCDCVEAVDLMTGEKLGWFRSIPLISRPPPKRCETCGYRFQPEKVE